MAGLDLTYFNDMLKDWYTGQRVEKMLYEDNAFLALVPKVTKFPGKGLPIPILYGNPQTTSADFTTAAANLATGYSRVEQFYLTRVKRYGFAQIDGETIKATESDEGAFLKAATTEIDGVMHQMKRDIAIRLFRTGWGEMGQVGSISGSTITLKYVEDVANFEVGQQLMFADDATSPGSNDMRGSGSPSTLSLTGVNRATGVLTFSAAVSTITGGGGSVTADDYIYLKADRQTAASGAVRRCIAGLEDWCPASAPTSTAFFAVDRSVDTRLGGLRLDATDGRPIEEALLDGATLAGREGQKLTHFFMSYTKFAALEKSLHGKVVYDTVKGSGNVGFNSIVIRGPRGDIKCVADQNCPSNRAFGVNFDYLKLYSLGPLVRQINDDGLMLLRDSSSDSVIGRFGFMGNLGCSAPGSLINIQVA